MTALIISHVTKTIDSRTQHLSLNHRNNLKESISFSYHFMLTGPQTKIRILIQSISTVMVHMVD